MKTIGLEEWQQLNVEFGQMATSNSTRVNVGALTILVSQERLMLLKVIEPYPIENWEVLYDSKDYVPEPESVSPLTTEKAEELVQLLRLAVQGYYSGQVDETDPAVPLVKHLLSYARPADVSLTDRAVQIVRTVRSMVPR